MTYRRPGSVFLIGLVLVISFALAYWALKALGIWQ